MDTKRMKDAKLGFIRNFRAAVKAKGEPFEMDHLVPPPEGVDLMAGTGATAEELLAYMRWEGSNYMQYASLLERAASAGLALDYSMHEVNSETYQVRSRLREVMKNLPEDSKDREVIDRAMKGVDRFSSLLSSMSTYSLGNLGSRWINGDDLLKQVDDVLGEALRRWKVELTASDDFLGCRMPGLEKYTVPVFINLIRNAFYWVDKSDRPRRIHLDAYKVDLEPDDEGNPRFEWIISVSDSGPGVDPGMRETIFEPFRSGRGSSGIGLYLCRQALGHGNTVVVDPEPSELGGARFLVGRKSVLSPAPALPPTMKQSLRSEAIGIAQLVADGKTRELIELYGDQYAELSREALRVRLEGPQDAEDRFLLRLADGIEDVLRSRATPEELQAALDDELGVDMTAPPRP